jgi:hypothetical protein
VLRLAARQVDLIARARELAEDAHREALEDAEFAPPNESERVLRRIGQVLREA